MKVVINSCFGGYSLSKEAYEFLGLEWGGYGLAYKDDRSNPKLIECVEALGDKASGCAAELKVVEIPDGIDWFIDEYDGHESVAESHRSWS